MAELNKRWDAFERNTSEGGRTVWRTYLGSNYLWRGSESLPMYVACIEYFQRDGPFHLDIWGLSTQYWEPAGTFDTLKQAKTMGRLLGGLALHQMTQGEKHGV